MSLLFCDGFDHYTTLTQKWTSTAAGVSITSGAARSGSNGLALTGGGNSTVTKQVTASQEHATFILGCAVNRAAGAQILLTFLSDSVATTHVTVQLTTNGEIKVFRGNTGGTQLGSTVSAGTIPVATWTYVEVKVVLHDSTGSVVVKVNGAQVFSATSQDTKNAGTKTVLDGFNIISGNSSIDDVYLLNGAGSSPMNDFLGDIKIETKFPSGAGTTTQLTPSTGSNFQCVDETPPNTTDFVGSSTNDQFDTYAFQDLTTAVGTVYAVVVYAYAAKSDAGAKGGAIMIRSGGTNYELTDNALGTGFAYFTEIKETDPATSAQWTISNVNAAEFGWKVKAS